MRSPLSRIDDLALQQALFEQPRHGGPRSWRASGRPQRLIPRLPICVAILAIASFPQTLSRAMRLPAFPSPTSCYFRPTFLMRTRKHSQRENSSALFIERRLTALVGHLLADVGGLAAHLEHDPLDVAPGPRSPRGAHRAGRLDRCVSTTSQMPSISSSTSSIRTSSRFFSNRRSCSGSANNAASPTSRSDPASDSASRYAGGVPIRKRRSMTFSVAPQTRPNPGSVAAGDLERHPRCTRVNSSTCSLLSSFSASSAAATRSMPSPVFSA